ncbi:glycosyltransferase [Gammaproteobacteria bacterium]|nr:glycosyltransferase [Gammaproteobacteria bacterium]
MLKVSIVTVCFNSDSTIRETITSVMSQSYQNIEHIFIDGGSKDQTLDIIECHSKNNSIIISEPDDGIYDAMNKGIKHSSGDLLIFLNADDFFASNKSIELAVDCAVAFPDSGLIAGSTLMDERYVWKPCNPARSALFYSQLPHPSLFVRKEALSKLKRMFRTEYSICADLDQQMRLIYKEGVMVSIVPNVLTIMRRGGASDSSFSWINSIRESILIYKKNFGNLYIVFAIQRMIRKVFERLVNKI